MSSKVLEEKLAQSQQAVARTQEAMAKVNAKFSTRAALSDPKQLIDIEAADLAAVQQHTNVMNGNIAELIMGLDDVTRSFSADFDQIRNKTGMEKFVGMFARGKSEAMRAERVRSASIGDKLTDLIDKSKVIGEILTTQLGVIREQRDKVEKNLEQTFADREETIGKLEAVRAEITALDPVLADLEMRLGASTDNVTRTRLETELAQKNAQHNALVQQEQAYLAESQTLERYVETGKTWVDSLQNQEATQLVLISKLEIDTKQRVVLYNSLTNSLKTAQQQDVAHRINEIGVDTDKNAQAAMAAIGAATNARMADMLEAHEDNMVFTQKVLEDKRRADERFNRRFAEIARKHDSAVYQPR